MNSVASSLNRFWSNNRSLILRLILPLAILSAILICLARPASFDDVSLNLATDLITIIITVLYVNWVISQHDKARWSTAEKYIASEAAAVGNAFIRDVAEALKIEDELFPRPSSLDVREIQASILDRVANLDRFVIEDALAKLTRQRWQDLMAIIDTRRGDSTPIISQFAARMSADQLSSMLAFRRVCSSIVSTYSLFDDFLGVPVPNLPKVKGGRPEEYTVITIIRLGIDFRAAFDASLGILNAFGYVIEPIPENTEEMKASWARWYERTSRKR
jgi:hypothetical protein